MKTDFIEIKKNALSMDELRHIVERYGPNPDIILVPKPSAFESFCYEVVDCSKFHGCLPLRNSAIEMAQLIYRFVCNETGDTISHEAFQIKRVVGYYSLRIADLEPINFDKENCLRVLEGKFLRMGYWVSGTGNPVSVAFSLLMQRGKMVSDTHISINGGEGRKVYRRRAPNDSKVVQVKNLAYLKHKMEHDYLEADCVYRTERGALYKLKDGQLMRVKIMGLPMMRIGLNSAELRKCFEAGKLEENKWYRTNDGKDWRLSMFGDMLVPYDKPRFLHV